jgi:CheY-like chemotaxis protein
MPTRYPIAFAGFSDFERSALASTFRLSVHRRPAYVQAESLAEGLFIVADADHPGVVEDVSAAGRAGDTVFIGARAPSGAGAWMMRPIDPSHVLHELDVLVSRRGVAGSPMAGPYSLPVGGARGPARTLGEGPGRRATDSGFGAGDLVPELREYAELTRRTQAASALETREALLVDDSELALRLLELKLQRTGLRTRCVLNSQQATRALAQRPADFIFLDVDLGPESELDGLSLCREIRRLPARPGRGAPVLVMVSANHSEIDRVRGSLAGSDAFLGKPLDDDALRPLLAQHGVHYPESAALGASMA